MPQTENDHVFINEAIQFMLVTKSSLTFSCQVRVKTAIPCFNKITFLKSVVIVTLRDTILSPLVTRKASVLAQISPTGTPFFFFFYCLVHFVFNDFFFPVIVGLQCCVNFYSTEDWPGHIYIYTYVYTFFFLTLSLITFHHKWLDTVPCKQQELIAYPL